MRSIISLVLSVFLLSATGCGYSTAALLPPDLKSIHVDNFVNKINLATEVSNKRASYSYFPRLEVDITRAVIDGFIFDRHLDVDRENKADLILEGQLISFRQLPLSYDDNENVEEFRIEIVVNIELYNNKTGELMWKENGFSGQTSYTITGPNFKTEAEAVKAAVKDLALRVVERTVEAW